MNTHVKHNQSGEDYLESILMLGRQQEVVHRIDVAKRMNVSQAAVNKAVKILVEKGYIYEDGKHLYLSKEGKCYAEAVYEKHCIIRDYLTTCGVSPAVYEKHCIIRDYLTTCGVSPAAAEEDACKLEHLISEETFSMMKKTLKQ